MATGVSTGLPPAGSVPRPYFEVYLALTRGPIPVYADTVKCDRDCGLVEFFDRGKLVFTVQKGRFVMAQRVVGPPPPDGCLGRLLRHLGLA
jgi:hypothetical protein